jgi:hypothetical protein
MCGDWIEAGEKPPHAAGLPQFPIHQTASHGVIAFRQGREAIQQSSQVESSSAYNDRQAAPGGDFANRISGHASVLTCGVTVGRVEHVQQVVRYPAALRFRRFGGADVESAVELEGIAIDDFAGEFLANAQCESAFARPGWTGDDQEGVLGGGIHLLPSYPAGPSKPIY